MSKVMCQGPANLCAKVHQPVGLGFVRRRISGEKMRAEGIYFSSGDSYEGCAIVRRRNKSVVRLGGRVGWRMHIGLVIAFGYRWDDDEIDVAKSQLSFADSVRLFNCGDYYSCHDVLEGLWNDASEPQRGILHGILQCAVAFHHLLNQNHRGAMVELGEGLNKLRKMQFKEGPLIQFEQEASAVLEFLYSTQLENAACGDDSCVVMDGSAMSYRLLGDFGAGRRLYTLLADKDGTPVAIQFWPHQVADLNDEDLAVAAAKVKLPRLNAEEVDLYRYF